MVQVIPLSPPEEKTSLMSKLSRLMILLSPATYDRENAKVNFKWFSVKTSLYVLCFFGPFLVVDLIGYLTGFHQQILSLDPTKNIIDIGSQVAAFAMLIASSALPFLFGSGIPSVTELALRSDLAHPKYGLLFIFGSLLSTVYVILGEYTNIIWMHSIDVF